MWDSVLSDKPLIAAPRELDRPLVLSHSRGLQSKGLLKKPAAATPCTASLVFSSQSLESCAVRVGRESVIASGASRAAIHKRR